MEPTATAAVASEATLQRQLPSGRPLTTTEIASASSLAKGQQMLEGTLGVPVRLPTAVAAAAEAIDLPAARAAVELGRTVEAHVAAGLTATGAPSEAIQATGLRPEPLDATVRIEQGHAALPARPTAPRTTEAIPTAPNRSSTQGASPTGRTAASRTAITARPAGAHLVRVAKAVAKTAHGAQLEQLMLSRRVSEGGQLRAAGPVPRPTPVPSRIARGAQRAWQAAGGTLVGVASAFADGSPIPKWAVLRRRAPGQPTHPALQTFVTTPTELGQVVAEGRGQGSASPPALAATPRRVLAREASAQRQLGPGRTSLRTTS